MMSYSQEREIRLQRGVIDRAVQRISKEQQLIAKAVKRIEELENDKRTED